LKRLLTIAIAGILTASCTKDIHLNLQNASGILVIEGNINDQPGPYPVILSQSVSYYDTTKGTVVSGARVVMSDDAGQRDSLTEALPGVYLTSTIVGIPGHTYHLSVTSGGKQYDAYSTMPAAVALDSIGVQSFNFGPRSAKSIYGVFTDPAAITNYYKFFLTVNNHRQGKVTVANDILTSGNKTQINVGADKSIEISDTVQMELDAIDKPVYNYWNTLNSSTLSQQTAAPSNPLSNWSNNALGYFSAHSLSRSHHIVVDPNGFHRID
jgi:hypothetical protein